MGKDERRIFTSGQIEKICKLLSDFATGSEIGHALAQIGLEDEEPGATKWRRMFNALAEWQNRHQSGNKVLSLIGNLLEPSRFSGNRARYEVILRNLNTVLSFQGLEYRDDGKFHRVATAASLSEAEYRAAALKKSVYERNLHQELLRFCRKELLEDNYFHAVLEATKGIAEIIRNRTGLSSDGATLIDEAFSGSSPRLKINEFTSDTHRSEQKGFVNLAKGLFGTFRNPTAHAPRISWDMEEQDALDLFTLASYVLRRIDSATQ